MYKLVSEVPANNHISIIQWLIGMNCPPVLLLTLLDLMIHWEAPRKTHVFILWVEYSALRGQPAAEPAFPNRMVIKFSSLSSKPGKHELCLFSPCTLIVLAFVAPTSCQTAERGTFDRKKTFNASVCYPSCLTLTMTVGGGGLQRRISFEKSVEQPNWKWQARWHVQPPRGWSKRWSSIKHRGVDQNQSDPGSPWIINTWLLLITSVHSYSRRNLRKKTKKEGWKTNSVCDL